MRVTGIIVGCVGLAASAAAQTEPMVVAMTTATAVPLVTTTIPPSVFTPPLPRERPENAPKPPAPNSLEDVCETLAGAARQHRLPVAFFGNLIWQESGLKPRIVSHAGARGIAQFMPGTARLVGLKNPFNPREALPASAKFLRMLLNRFGHNYGLAAAAYNAGPGRIDRWVRRRTVLPKETRHYVQTITGRRAEQWLGERDHAMTLTRRIPCPTLRAFADVENHPVDEEALQPVKLVLRLPLPLPRPSREIAALVPEPGASSEAEPLTATIEMKLPDGQAAPLQQAAAVSADAPADEPADEPVPAAPDPAALPDAPAAGQPADGPTASIPEEAPALPAAAEPTPPQPEPVAKSGPAPAAPRAEKPELVDKSPARPATAPAARPLPRPNPLRLAMLHAHGGLALAPLPRANPRRHLVRIGER